MGVKIREKVKGSGVFWVFINHKNRRTSKKVGRRQNASKVAEQIEAQLKLGQSPIHETEGRFATHPFSRSSAFICIPADPKRRIASLC